LLPRPISLLDDRHERTDKFRALVAGHRHFYANALPCGCAYGNRAPNRIIARAGGAFHRRRSVGRHRSV
jgi:hypothetical protein